MLSTPFFGRLSVSTFCAAFWSGLALLFGLAPLGAALFFLGIFFFLNWTISRLHQRAIR